MRGVVTILFAMVLISCTSIKNTNTSGCDENKEFKENFFDCVSIIEKYTLQKTKGKGYGIKLSDFESSLKKLSQFVEISHKDILNYNYSYPSIEVFEKDKQGWELWYEKNKCKNLQWKK